MRVKKNALFIALIASLQFSCDRPSCTNKNSIFDTFSPTDEEYKRELALNINSQQELSYWIEGYKESGLLLNVQGTGLCAICDLTVRNWKKLQVLKDAKGKGYIGAEIKELEIEVVQDSLKTEFVFVDLESIVD